MIAIAREKAMAEGVAHVALSQADLFDAAAPPGPDDAALAFNFLQLMPDMPSALAAITRRLRPDGLFISKTNRLGEPGWRVVRTVVRGLKAVGVGPPLQFHRIETVDRAVESAGFALLERGVFPDRPPARFLVARKAA